VNGRAVSPWLATVSSIERRASPSSPRGGAAYRISERQHSLTEDANFPHAVLPPYGVGWEHALTKKHGQRGKKWTSTPSKPQWTVRFKEAEAAAWFKEAWTTR
jgi:hypothetical protein